MYRFSKIILYFTFVFQLEHIFFFLIVVYIFVVLSYLYAFEVSPQLWLVVYRSFIIYFEKDKNTYCKGRDKSTVVSYIVNFKENGNPPSMAIYINMSYCASLQRHSFLELSPKKRKRKMR